MRATTLTQDARALFKNCNGDSCGEYLVTYTELISTGTLQ